MKAFGLTLNLKDDAQMIKKYKEYHKECLARNRKVH